MEKKLIILEKMVKGNIVGMSYKNKRDIVGSIPIDERGNIDDLLDDLNKKGIIEYHKNNECVSINKKAKGKVREMLEDRVADYIWDNW